MSVQTVSGSSNAWQVLAEMRAARAAAIDPATDETQGSAWSGAAQGGSASTGVTGAAPAPPPPANVLQFFQQLQSVDSAPPPAATDPSGGAADANAIGGDTTGLLANLQSLLAAAQPGSAAGTVAGGVPQGQAAPSGDAGASSPVAANGTADPFGATVTQTGNDLALQWLGGLQGTPWQPGGALGLATLAG